MFFCIFTRKEVPLWKIGFVMAIIANECGFSVMPYIRMQKTKHN